MDESSKNSILNIILSLWAGLVLGMIIIGAVAFDFCPVEPKIPIYLIVAGSMMLLALILIPIKIVCETSTYIIEGILALFSFCWFIAGSVWVFSTYNISPRQCNSLTYNFAFVILIFQYICLLLVLIIVSCVCCSDCTALFDSGSNNLEMNAAQSREQHVSTIQNTV